MSACLHALTKDNHRHNDDDNDADNDVVSVGVECETWLLTWFLRQ